MYIYIHTYVFVYVYTYMIYINKLTHTNIYIYVLNFPLNFLTQEYSYKKLSAEISQDSQIQWYFGISINASLSLYSAYWHSNQIRFWQFVCWSGKYYDILINGNWIYWISCPSSEKLLYLYPFQTTLFVNYTYVTPRMLDFYLQITLNFCRPFSNGAGKPYAYLQRSESRFVALHTIYVRIL